MAELLGMAARGSIGVILFAAATHSASEAQTVAALDALESQSTLWMSSKVRAEARRMISEIYRS